ncbi:hypothetical protein CSB37_03515 [bacterium DOLZORAL124_38_8]|nr:MAG: hypothetical protein CSB37_03515 [bacterium DOLZORAL124_38_8]
MNDYRESPYKGNFYKEILGALNLLETGDGINDTIEVYLFLKEVFKKVELVLYGVCTPDSVFRSEKFSIEYLDQYIEIMVNRIVFLIENKFLSDVDLFTKFMEVAIDMKYYSLKKSLSQSDVLIKDSVIQIENARISDLADSERAINDFLKKYQFNREDVEVIHHKKTADYPILTRNLLIKAPTLDILRCKEDLVHAVESGKEAFLVLVSE